MGILGDIARRELHGGTRKEDDINLLDRDRFITYFEEHYKWVFKYKNTYDGLLVPMGIGDIQYVTIPIIYNNKYIYYLLYEFKNYKPDKLVMKTSDGVYYNLCEKYPNFFKKYKFKCTIVSGGYIMDIDDELTNEFTLKFIDDIIEIGDEKLWEKKQL